MSADIHMFIVRKDKKPERIFEGVRDPEWFDDISGNGYHDEYEKLPIRGSISPFSDENIQKLLKHFVMPLRMVNSCVFIVLCMKKKCFCLLGLIVALFNAPENNKNGLSFRDRFGCLYILLFPVMIWFCLKSLEKKS